MSLSRRYDVHEAIGRGAFGTVYRAFLVGEGGFRKEVAIKVLNPKAATMDGVVERLRDEARMLGRVRHRAILEVDGLVFLDGRWALVTEFVKGCSLLEALRTGPMPLGAALEVVGEIASALHVAYNTTSPKGQPLHLVHRDIKPANVQITAAGEVKILDFGIAQADFDAREAITQAMVLGTPAYMAPERFAGRTGPESDIYALAVVLCEMVTAERVGKTSIQAEQHAQHVTKAVRDVLAIEPAFEEVLPLVEKMMAHDPAARPNAKDVERLARTARTALPGPWLAEWADANVPGIMARSGGPLDGNTLCGQSLREGVPRPIKGTAPGAEVRQIEVATPPSVATVKPANAVARRMTGPEAAASAGALLAASVLGVVLVSGTFAGAVRLHAEALPTIVEATPPAPVQVVHDPPPAPAPSPTPAPQPEPSAKEPAPPTPTMPVVVSVARPAAPPRVKRAGPLISAGEYASWIASHPEWLPESARADGRADDNYLWGWAGAVPPNAAAPAVAVPYAAAEALCQPRGGLASADAEPTSWIDTTARMQEWRVSRGKAAWLRNDGKRSTAVRRAESNIFTSFRCAQ